ncbi:hypothetical protein AeNC1_008969, partial [Aphanomyces euteiches]
PPKVEEAKYSQTLLDDKENSHAKLPVREAPMAPISVPELPPVQANSQGLVNLGNTCYMNSVLQAILSLTDFIDVVKDEAWLSKMLRLDASKISFEKESYDVLSHFKEMIKSKLNKSPLHPAELKSALAKRVEIFANNEQQDAHEFFSTLLHELEEDLRSFAAKQLEADAATKSSKLTLLSYFASDKPKPLSIPTESLPIAAHFQTTINQTLTCVSCSYSRSFPETFRELSLDLPSLPFTPRQLCLCRKPPIELTVKKEGENKGRKFLKCNNQNNPCKFWEWAPQAPPSPKPLDLTQLLAEHFKPHQVDVTCEKCSEGKQAIMTAQIQSLPKVLVLHLKRFEVQQSVLTKRLDRVATPLTLNPGEWLSQGTENCTYSLKSIVRHLGQNVDEGHYVADVDEGTWIRYNDTFVSEVDSSAVLEGNGAKSGYLLFYAR